MNVIEPAKRYSKVSCSYGCDDSFIVMEDDKADYFCTNPECPSVYGGVVEKLIFAFSPKSFSEEMKDIILDVIPSWDHEFDKHQNILTSFIKAIKEERFDFVAKTLHQTEMIRETLNNIYKKELTLTQLVDICSIYAFGETLSKELEKQIVGDPNEFLKNKPILIVNECNNSRARESWKNRHSIICQMIDCFKIKIEKKDNMSKGKVCITGKSPSGITKKEFDSIIESKGYEQVDSVTKETDILICNKPNSSKDKKARSLGKIVLTEEEFINNY
jgi:NAD-dependent DNA ligase